MKNVLIIDDEESIRKFILLYLKQMIKDLVFFEADDVDSALGLIEERGSDFFSLFITDVIMPKKTGIELVTELRKMKILTPVIVMSGYDCESSIWSARDLGAVCFVQKPDLGEKLAMAIVNSIKVAMDKNHPNFIHWGMAKDGSQKISHLTSNHEVLESVSRKDEEEKKNDEKMWGCISSHTVCPLGEEGYPCAHCVSWRGKNSRSLTIEEMIEEITDIRIYNELSVDDPLHVGINGKGDATLNPNVYTLLENPPGNVSFRVSTPGITMPFPKFIPVTNPLEYFVDRVKGNPNLRVFQGSLMGPTDEVRNRIIRIGRVCPIKDLMKYGIQWALDNDKLFYLNYVMIRGVNDKPEYARKLVELLRDLPALVKITQLMPCNGLLPSFKKDVRIFTSILSEGDIRWVGFLPKGADITGCGMLGAKLH